MTMHRDFANTTCPADFLAGCMYNISVAVNNIIMGGVIPTEGYFINGYDYAPVFDPVYYSNKYADLKLAFGDDSALLWEHFQQFGMSEFRQASAEFNPTVYKEKYADVAEAYGEDNEMYYFHYVAFGKNEGRTTN